MYKYPTAWTQDPQNSPFFFSRHRGLDRGAKKGRLENKKKKGIPPPPLNPSPYPSPFPDLGKISQMQFPIAKMYISHFMARRLRSAQPCLRVAVSHLPDSSEGKKVAQTDRQSSSCQTRRLRLLLLALTRRPG